MFVNPVMAVLLESRGHWGPRGQLVPAKGQASLLRVNAEYRKEIIIQTTPKKVEGPGRGWGLGGGRPGQEIQSTIPGVGPYGADKILILLP